MTTHIRCCYCGRVTLNPAAFIGAYPVGSTCARKYLPNAPSLRRRMHAIRFVSGARGHASTAKRDPSTLDLFEGVAA